VHSHNSGGKLNKNFIDQLWCCVSWNYGGAYPATRQRGGYAWKTVQYSATSCVRACLTVYSGYDEWLFETKAIVERIPECSDAVVIESCMSATSTEKSLFFMNLMKLMRSFTLCVMI
jgi:hypothetical protein